MQLICGLGNPGRKFKWTRHNLGFEIIDQFAWKQKFPRFRISKKFRSLVSRRIMNEEKIILAKPQTFMNDSGLAVKALIGNYKPKIADLIVIHDDVDLPLGEIRIVRNRGAAGHKGVQSIINKLGTKNFVRFRIGIKPETCHLKLETLDKFVLKKFNKDERKVLKEVINKTVKALDFAIKKGIEKAQSTYNIFARPST